MNPLPRVALLLSLVASLSAPAWAAKPVAEPMAGPVVLVDVGLGESVVQTESRSVSRVLISDPSIAELRLLEEGQYQIRGVGVGSTDLWVWYRDDVAHPRKYAVVVSADLTDIERRIQATVAGPAPRVYAARDRIVAEGEVADVETLERVAQLVRIYDPEFVNLLTVRGDHQVQLKVVFAEVNRTGLREMGLNVFFNPPGVMGSMTGPTQQSSAANIRHRTTNEAPNLSNGLVSSPVGGAFNLVGYMYGAIDAAALLSVLEQQSVVRTLAEPTVSAMSGQQAMMLVGGEIPIPTAQMNGMIAIEFKEYGVKVVFVPTVLSGDVIDVRAYIEVSDMDPANALRLSGIEIPALTSRKGESHLRIESGKTFALAGMLSERVTSTQSRIPLLGDIPVLGALFRYVKHQRSETELVVFVTPEIIRPLVASEVPAVPGSTENFNPNDFELFMLGSLTAPGSRVAKPVGPYGMAR